MSIKKQAIKSVFSNWLGYFCFAVISFFSTPIIVHSLGNGGYGIWAIIMSVTGYYNLLNLGIYSAANKYVSEYNAKGDVKEINKIINTSLVIFLGIALIIFCISLIFANHFSSIFKVELEDTGIIRNVIIIVGLNLSVSFALKPFSVVLTALKRFDLLNLIGVSSAIVRVLFVVAVLKSGFGLIGMAIVIFIVDFLTQMVTTFVSFKVCKGLKLGFLYIEKETFRRLLSFGKFNFMINVSRTILQRSGQVIAGIFLGASQVAFYSISEGLITHTGQISRGVSRVTLPLASELGALNQIEKIKNMFLFVPKYLLLIAIFIGIVFFIMGDELIEIWMGPGYYTSYIILCLLMVPRIGIMTHEMMINAIIGMGHNRFFGIMSIGEAAANVILSLILVKKYGLIGIAIGTLIPLTISRLFVVPIYCCKIVNIHYREYCRKVILPPVFTGIPCFLIILYISQFITPHNYLTLFGEIIASFGIFSIFAYFISVDDEHKLSFKNNIINSGILFTKRREE